ncbi:MAG: hypothetical protein LBQ80_03165 [Clostridium sp.]|jgi:hypothetical protein|nr:hypothetical protein [Clostridium sp.]
MTEREAKKILLETKQFQQRIERGKEVGRRYEIGKFIPHSAWQNLPAFEVFTLVEGEVLSELTEKRKKEALLYWYIYNDGAAPKIV